MRASPVFVTVIACVGLLVFWVPVTFWQSSILAPLQAAHNDEGIAQSRNATMNTSRLILVPGLAVAFARANPDIARNKNVTAIAATVEW